MEKILEVQNLKKYFATASGMLHAVDDLSFSLEKGKTLGVVGESGCGKSTLGRVVVGLLNASAGEVIFDGRPLSGMSNREKIDLKQEMQIIFQDPFSSLNPRMNIFETIAEPLRIFKVYSSEKEINEHVYRIMDTVGLARRLDRNYPHELDGGRRQRVGIGRALVLKPRFIVCDEPVSALDVSIQAQILNLLMDLQERENLTYLFITHDLSVVRHISDDILVMYLGVVFEKSESKELFKRPLHPYTKALINAIPVPKIKERKKKELLLGEVTSPIEPKDVCRFADRCKYVTDICRQKSPKLEEVKQQHFVACHNVREINAEYL
jgi:oligopeptide/dipeptide ABC transporter ATP-binding protein